MSKLTKKVQSVKQDGRVSAVMASDAREKLTQLAAFVKKHCQPEVPSLADVVATMRLAAQEGISLPKALRVYAKGGSEFGVVSSNAKLSDRDELARSLSRRTRYHYESLGFAVADYNQLDSKTGQWVAPKWETTPAERRAKAVAYYCDLAEAGDELAQAGL